MQGGVSKGLPLVIPKGRFRLASTVTLPAGVRLRGAGGDRDASTTSDFVGTWLRGAVRFNSNVSVSDMKIGDKLSQRTVSPAGPAPPTSASLACASEAAATGAPSSRSKPGV